MVALLHDIRSAHNVASIFRTADGAGVEKLYLCGITPGPLDVFGRNREDFAKVALGAEKTVPFEKVARTADCIRRLRAAGWFICALELAPGAVPYCEAACLKANAGKIAIIVGHETEGVPKTILARCDAVVAIPMHGTKESLNVSVAFGVIAFEIAAFDI